ncbi:TolC family protein [Candidatus Xiphinematobacter sp. Idaho Grape]|uniref:TolC family protein n=1 Tax=Candidatus Xiphinematobacter sp. Idaho Grape TaxID=1704307 RepID=UPI00130E2E82|nr:TolC family protein [Candidatus Xiphinematobacter sp. Idaho Grape]
MLSTVLFTTSLQAELSITSPSFFLIPSSGAQSSFPVASYQATPFFPLTSLPVPFCSRRSNRMSLASVANFSASGVLFVTPLLASDSVPHVRPDRIKKLGINPKLLTLNDAMRYALRHNPEILNSIQQIRSVHGKLISTRAQLLPRLVATSAFQDVPSSITNAFNEIPPVTDSSPMKFPSGRGTVNHFFWKTQLAAQQLVFDGGGSLAGMRAVKHQENMSFFTLRSTIDSVIAQVKTAFFRVILDRALVAVQEQSVALLEDQLESQKKHYQVGTVPKLDVLQAQAAVASAASTLVRVQNNLCISQHQLVKLLGMNYTKHAEIPFRVVGDLEVRFCAVSSEEAVRIGLARSPILKAQRECILSQAASVREAISNRYPKITLGGGYLVQNNTRSHPRRATGGWFFGLNGTWNVFGGLNAYSSEVIQSKALLEQSRIRYDNSARSVIASIQQSIADLRQAQEVIRSQQANVVQAAGTLRLAREQFDSGVGTQLEVFNAKIKLLQSQTAVLQARFGYIQALAQYEAMLSINTQYKETEALLTNKEQQHFEKLNSAG